MVRTPRYKQLADELRAEITAGDYSKDSFPTESELCKRYAVSRFTVREALRALQGEGLIARKRGSGTMIQSAAARGGALHQPLSNVAEILQYARDTRAQFAALGQGPLPRVYAEQIGIVAGGQWSRFRGLRRRTDSSEPLAYTEAFVHESLRAISEKIDPSEDTLFRQIESLAKIKIVKVTQDIQAVAAPSEVAKALGLVKRAPCLRILRCYHDTTDRILEVSASHHPGDKFAYSMHIDVEG
ncbi:MAG: GntR family transcriptional regulator [Sphingorhabdus sp.]